MIAQIIAIIAIVGIDRAVKMWAVSYLLPEGSIALIPGLIGLTYRENTGMAFGLLPDMRWLFVGLTALVLGFIVLAFIKGWVSRPFEKWSLALILGGALGNFIDRAYQGYVVDMFEFQFINFAIFNVADIFVSVGGVMICAYFIFCRPQWPVFGKNDKVL